MIKPAPKLREKNEGEVSELARNLAVGFTGHPTVVATPKVTATQLNDGAQALDDAVQTLSDYDAGRKPFADAVVNKRALLEGLIVTSTDDTAVQTGYDRMKMELLNVPLPRTTPLPTDISPLQNLHLTHGDHEGYVDGGCDRRDRATMYRLRCGQSATGPWLMVYEGNKSSFTITGQPLGVLCYFQMQAFVGGVWTDWSDLAQLRIV